MAALTWRDVAAPDFRTSLAGIEASGRMLDHAFGAARKTLDDYDNSISDRVNNAFQLQLLKYSDPDKYEAALAVDPTLGFDPKRLNAQSLNMAGNRVNTLLNQGIAKENLGWNQYSHDRTKSDNAAVDAAKADAASYISAALSGDPHASKILANSSSLKGLTPDQLIKLASEGQSLTKGNVDIAGAKQDQKFNLDEHNWKSEDRNINSQGAALAAKALSHGDNPESWLAALEANSTGVDPRAVAIARQQITGQVGNIYAGGGGLLSAAGGTASPGSTLATTYGGGTLPSSVQTVGDAVDYGPTLVKTLGASPMGVYQINYGTLKDFAPKALGKDWQNANFRDINVQDKIAQKIFESTGGDPQKLVNRWASLRNLPASQVAQIAKMPWSKARQYIASGESNTDLSTYNPAVTAIQAAVTQSQGLTDNNPQGFAKGLGKADTPVEAARLIASNMKGVPVSFLTSQIGKIVDRSRVKGQPTVNPAQAAQIILDNYTQAQSDEVHLPWWLGGTGTPDIGTEGLRLNDDGITQAIEAAKKGQQVTQLANAANSKQTEALVQQATNQVLTLQNRVRQLRLEVVSRPGLTGELRRAEGQLAAAIMSAQQLRNSVIPNDRERNAKGAPGLLIPITEQEIPSSERKHIDLSFGAPPAKLRH